MLFYVLRTGCQWNALPRSLGASSTVHDRQTGPNPTDRAKSGTKRSILVDGKGVPLGVCVDGDNRHDMKMTKATLQSIVIYRPDPTIRSKAAHVHGQRLRVSRGIRITGRVWLYNSHQIKR